MGTGSLPYYILLVILILAGGYFAATEMAFASVSKIKLKNRAEGGDTRAKKAIYITNHFDKALTTLLVGNNVMHIGCASLTTLIASTLWGKQAVPMATLFITVVVFLISEMIPKSYAKSHSERLALSVAPSLRFFMRVLTPVTVIFTGVSRLAGKLFIKEEEPTVTEDELYDIIENIQDQGAIEPDKSKLILATLEFDDILVQDILTARVDLVALDIEMTPREIVEVIKGHKHSRLPVYEDSVDNIVGVLQIRKYLKTYLKQGEETDLRALLDPPHFVHQSVKIADLLKELSGSKLHMSVVTDEYGGTMGIVTVEDILEELVGEIWDEDDEEQNDIVDLGGGRYVVSGQMDAQDAFELMDYDDFDREDIGRRPMGAWAFTQFDRMPREGDEFLYRRLKVKIRAMNGHRIGLLEVEEIPPEEGREEE